MAFGFSKTRFSPIAVDFGADSLKMLQIGLDEPPFWKAAARESLPESAHSNNPERLKLLESTIRRLLKEGMFNGRRAICSIPAFQTLVHHMEIPNSSSGEDVQRLVNLELRERLNIEPTRMVMRLFKMEPVVRSDGPRQRVICLAAKRDAVMAYVELLQRCKLEVVGMNSEPICIIRAFSHIFRREADAQRTTCFIDIGAAITKVVIAHGKNMVFAKDIDAGGDMLVREVASRSQMSFAEARKAIANGEVELTADMAKQTAVMAEDPMGTVSGFVLSEEHTASPDKKFLDHMIDEVRLCLRYYTGIYRDRRIEKLVFLGGEAHNRKLCQRIAEALNIPAMIGDPMARLVRRPNSVAIGVPTDQPLPGWATTLGLCLSDENL